MNKTSETPMTFEDHTILDHSLSGGMGRAYDESVLPPLQPEDELDWLMSLALDNALEPNEAARLDVLLGQATENRERWASWQSVDSAFHQVPSVLPPVDFGDKFARRLQIQERQRRLRTGVIFGVAAAALWGSALVGMVMLGALVWSNQGSLLADIVHNIAYWWAAAGQYWQVLLNTLEALWVVPQTRALFACYVVTAVAILAGWFVLLRRSTHEVPVADVQFVKA